jgi:hypothetical protein
MIGAPERTRRSISSRVILASSSSGAIDQPVRLAGDPGHFAFSDQNRPLAGLRR